MTMYAPPHDGVTADNRISGLRVLYLVPDLFEKPGGIARCCALVAKVLNESSQVKCVDVIALHDSDAASVDGRYLSGDRFSYQPCSGDRLVFARAALSLQHRRPYDLLLAGHINLLPLVFAPIMKQRRARRIVFAHGVDAWDPLPWHRRWFLRRADMVISVSHHTAGLAERSNGLTRDRVHVLHNCLDPTLSRSEEVAGNGALHSAISTTPNTILTVARLSSLEPGKGHSIVIQALPSVRRRIPDVRYLVVGDGDYRPTLERLATELKVADCVTFVGRVTDPELAAIYTSSRLFVMPSRVEGFGFVYLEAMAYGLPIVGGNRDATPEVVGDAGLLVDPSDAHQVADAIVRLLQNSDLRFRCITAGRLRLESLFTYARFRDTLLSQLLQLLP